MKSEDSKNILCNLAEVVSGFYFENYIIIVLAFCRGQLLVF